MKNSPKQITLYVMLVTTVLTIALSGCTKPDSKADLCKDGIQNQNETGVDCGGACAACGASDFRVKSVYGFNGTDTTSSDEYTYDDRGRITSNKYSNIVGAGTITYSYKTDTVIEFFAPTQSTKTYTLNSDGYAVTEVITNNSGSVVYSTTYTYDAEGHLNGDTWTNGNLTYTNNFNGTTFTYLTDKPNTISNENYGKGFLGKESKNLVNVKTGVNYTTTYLYQYDSQGRVIQQSESGSTAYRTEYNYY